MLLRHRSSLLAGILTMVLLGLFMTSTISYLSAWMNGSAEVITCCDPFDAESEKEAKKFGEDTDDKIPGHYRMNLSIFDDGNAWLNREALSAHLFHPDISTPPPERT